MRQAEDSEINDSDLRLVEDILFAVEAHAFEARKCLEAAVPAGDCPVCGVRAKGEPA